jgi:hypothetical protein
LQRRGREILQEMAARNASWLNLNSQPVDDYAYSFQFANEPGRQWAVKQGKPVAGVVRYGISHHSAVHHLTDHPEAAVFRQVDISDDTITLTYRLRDSIRVSAGNGVLGRWRGFFSRNLREGVLILDARRLVPIEHRSGDLRETFSQYQQLADDQFVPLAVSVNRGGHNYRWTFQTFEPGLWLFAASHNESSSEEPIATLNDVHIAGVAQQPIHVGRPEWPEAFN